MFELTYTVRNLQGVIYKAKVSKITLDDFEEIYGNIVGDIIKINLVKL